ncbi:protein-glutamate O-methyltransferase CheR [Fulvivirgaceae bacterium PWU5]|uniref:protein-glutamate O-methyltransferase n=1 Tax=Dawidia cretensis TaxID=2782350 RepID=A0AAP2GNR7_9BACT|nr:protein-glutamate O-methyltransferase CheR [Dawidia cretensis]MBT1707489.1 protein-glutamate O-methyltransferase CheR [Dawidia cretensis]
MMTQATDQPLFVRMDDESFARLSSYVTREYGIKLPVNKRSMLESRLNKKVKSLGLDNYKQFLDHIFSEEEKQGDLLHVIDLITTNKTDFFREPEHFKFLSGSFLPAWTEQANRQAMNVWSAGCSSGEEPYTLVMVLEEFRKRNPAFNYSLLASDVSIRMIQAAFKGVYTLDKIAAISNEMRRAYFLRSKVQPDLVRVKPEYRKKINYRRINFMDDGFGLIKHDYDIIFCRNVLIYFDKATQERVIRKFAEHLRPGGLLFLGHSESIMGMNVPFRQLRPTVYQAMA